MKKEATSYRLSVDAKQRIKEASENLGLNETSIIELAVRELAMGRQFNIRDLPDRTEEQISNLANWTGYTKTQIVLIAVENLWKEVKKERESRMTQHVIGVEFETYADRKAAMPELESLFEDVTRRETKKQGIHVICSKPIGKTDDEAFEICRNKWVECGWINADSV